MTVVMTSPDHLPTFADVEAAAERLRGMAVRTPVLESEALNERAGGRVLLKAECLQRTGSFKFRGAYNAISQSAADAVVAYSSGNHAQGVAAAARMLGKAATIVMPADAPAIKVENTRGYGAEVRLYDRARESREAIGAEIAARTGAALIRPYDDPRIIAGQGTMALEMVQDVPQLDTLVVPVGGGGMIAGCAVAARGLKPEMKVIGVESAGYSAMRQLLAGEPVTAGGDTIAEGIAVRDIGNLPLTLCRSLLDRVVAVDEVAIEHAIALLLEIEKTVTEGAGATGLAALLACPDLFTGRKVGLVLSGGNIDTRLLASVLMRGLVRDGRIVRLRLRITDAPGQLARVASIIGNAGGNIVEVQHQRLFGGVVAKAADLDVTVETRDRHHIGELVSALQADGFAIRVLEGVEA
jgi:threonine dehydratase